MKGAKGPKTAETSKIGYHDSTEGTTTVQARI